MALIERYYYVLYRALIRSKLDLYVEATMGMRRTRLFLQYCVKLMSNEINLAYSAVYQSDIVATYEAKEKVIEPL